MASGKTRYQYALWNVTQKIYFKDTKGWAKYSLIAPKLLPYQENYRIVPCNKQTNPWVVYLPLTKKHRVLWVVYRWSPSHWKQSPLSYCFLLFPTPERSPHGIVTISERKPEQVTRHYRNILTRGNKEPGTEEPSLLCVLRYKDSHLTRYCLPVSSQGPSFCTS